MKTLILFLLLTSTALASESTGSGNGPDLSGEALPIGPDKGISEKRLHKINRICGKEHLDSFVLQVTGKPCVPVAKDSHNYYHADICAIETTDEVTFKYALILPPAYPTDPLWILITDSLVHNEMHHAHGLTMRNTLDDKIYPSITYQTIENITEYDAFGRITARDIMYKNLKILMPPTPAEMFFYNNTSTRYTEIPADSYTLTACLIRELSK